LVEKISIKGRGSKEVSGIRLGDRFRLHAFFLALIDFSIEFGTQGIFPLSYLRFKSLYSFFPVFELEQVDQLRPS